jgi:hypothetical protein
MSTGSRNEILLSTFESHYLVGVASPCGHSISNVSSGRAAAPPRYSGTPKPSFLPRRTRLPARVDVPRNSLTTAVQNSMLVPPSLLRPFDRWARCHGPDVADLVGKLDQLGGMALVPRGRLAFIARSNGAASARALSRVRRRVSLRATRYRTRVVENLHRHAKAFGFVLQPMRAS